MLTDDERIQSAFADQLRLTQLSKIEDDVEWYDVFDSWSEGTFRQHLDAWMAKREEASDG